MVIFKSSFLSVIVFFLLISCNQNLSNEQRSEFSGGTLRINENSGYESLFPHTVNDLVSARIISQIHMGLLKYDTKKYSVVSGVASDWDLDNSGTIYTFRLNPKARFQDNSCFENGIGRKITAVDFKYTFELLAKNFDPNSNFSTIEKIKGAKAYRADSTNTIKEIEGIKIVDDTTLVIVLERPFDLFEYQMASPSAVVLPKEAVDAYGDKLIVGAGAFILKEKPFKGENVVITRNENFFLTDSDLHALPFLDSVVISFISSPKNELRMLEEDKLDLVMNIRSDYTVDFLTKYIREFKKRPPEYILIHSEKISNSSTYNIIKAEVRNFYVNKMDNFDLSIVYKKKLNDTIVRQ